MSRRFPNPYFFYCWNVEYCTMAGKFVSFKGSKAFCLACCRACWNASGGKDRPGGLLSRRDHFWDLKTWTSGVYSKIQWPFFRRVLQFTLLVFVFNAIRSINDPFFCCGRFITLCSHIVADKRLQWPEGHNWTWRLRRNSLLGQLHVTSYHTFVHRDASR